MPIKFSGNEVIEIAIQIEKRGYEFYTLLKNNAKKNEMKKFFNWLANEEKKHIHVFEDLRETFTKIDLKVLNNWNEVALYFKSLIDNNVFPEADEDLFSGKELEDEIGAIHIAISFEKDNILYFQEIRELVEENEKEIINKLINEEKSHIMKLLEIKKHISAT